jgi:hypothetical protein
VTADDLQKAWAATLMLDGVESDVVALLREHGLSRARDAKPEHYRPLVEGLVRILRARGK